MSTTAPYLIDPTTHLEQRLTIRALDALAAATGPVDGGWRASSNDLEYELPKMVSALTEHVGPIERILYRLGDWQRAPRRFVSQSRAVYLDGYRFQPPHTLAVRTRANTRLVLLVVPWTVDDATAGDILHRASDPLNDETVPQLLGMVLTNVAPFTDPAVAGQRWDDDGGMEPAL